MLYILIDGNNLAYRANSVMELSHEGFRTSAIYGFFNSIKSLVSYYSPDRVVVAWDRGASIYRREICSEYKQHRKIPEDDVIQREKLSQFYKQLPIIRRLLSYVGIPSVRVRGIEADDILILCATMLRDLGNTVYIVSSDADMLQCIDDGISVVTPHQDKAKRKFITKDNFFEKIGIKREHFLDYRIMVGDSSDGIKGVLGIGEKTANMLVNNYGSIDNMWEAEELIKCNETKRVNVIFTPETREIIKLNRKLMEVTFDYIPEEELDKLKNYLKKRLFINIKSIKRQRLSKSFVKYGMREWLEDFGHFLMPFENLQH